MSELNFSPEQALELFNSTDEFPVDFDVAWQWIEYGRKADAKVHFLKCNFLEAIDYKVYRKAPENSNGGRPTEKILLTVDCFKMWAMMANTVQGRLVRQYFLECEKIAKQKAQPKALPEVTEETVKTYIYGIEYLTNSGDLQLAQLLKNQFGNTLLASQQRSLQGDCINQPEGVIDVAIRLGFRVSKNHEASLGKYVKKQCAHLIQDKGNRYSNASSKQIQANMYPAFSPEVEKAVTEYCIARGISNSRITLPD
jgi:phage anti-repressor protein